MNAEPFLETSLLPGKHGARKTITHELDDVMDAEPYPSYQMFAEHLETADALECKQMISTKSFQYDDIGEVSHRKYLSCSKF